MAANRPSTGKTLKSHPSGVLRESTTSLDKRMFEEADIDAIIFPWMKAYNIWWSITVLGAIFTVFFIPYQIAFQKEKGIFNDGATIVYYILMVIFSVDITVNFNLALYQNKMMVVERKQIAKSYCQGMFWLDFFAVFPFEYVALAISGEIGERNNKALYLSLYRLLGFLRLHRMAALQDMLQHDSKVSLIWFTLLRNLSVALVVTHFSACAMYFLARLNDFDENTWLGPLVFEMNGFERYVVSLYWSVVTFATVGYGDFTPVSSAERIWGCIFMFLNIVVQSWIIGSITLLIVKNDEKTCNYRDALQVLNQYSTMHDFDEMLQKNLKTQLKLDFNNREIADEQVLKNFPSAVRRKVLRQLYLPSLIKTDLMKNVRQQFVDAFLTSCSVEIFSPGEEIVERGSISSDLFLLVGGIAEITTPSEYTNPSTEFTSILKERDRVCEEESGRKRQLEEGYFIGEIGFFTESPQVDSVTCLTVCKTLTMSKSAYKLITQDHPGSVAKILHNLLAKVEGMALSIKLPNMAILRAGSVFDDDASSSYGSLNTEKEHQKHQTLTAVQDLVKMHMERQKDDQTTRLLFAASRGDTATITLMCDQGFDPNNADYDNRTALMVSAMKGNTAVVKTLLGYNANPNLTDVHGSSALYEAVKNGHEKTMDLLLEYAAELRMKESLAASVLCQAVFDGDILFLKRLLRANIQINASDYDKRTSAHIAAAEGNVAALRVLFERGADLTLEDRWKNTVRDESEKGNSGKLTEYLTTIKAAQQVDNSSQVSSSSS
jgi:ankyrin repeat protein/CRP-like cAMP-binding protein